MSEQRSATAAALSGTAFATLLLIAFMMGANHVAARMAFDHGLDVATEVTVRSGVTALVVGLLVVVQRVPVQLTARHRRTLPVIGLLEANGYSFQDGHFTDFTAGGFQQSSGDTGWSAGPGLRIAICNKVDLGASAMFGLTQGNPEQIYRSELRLRF